MATVFLVYELGRQLYGRRTGLVAALLLAVMPYHVVVSRQVLLDGPMTMLATLTLLLLVRFVLSGRVAWLYATGAAMGLTFLAKETSIVLLFAIYAFLALTPELRVRLRDLAISMGVMVLVIAPFPLSLVLSGRSGTGESYLTWQLFRRPNHDWVFYASNVPEMIGPLVLAAAVAGLVIMRRRGSWPERLLLCWIAVPVLFFELWPVKGFQYLLPIVAPVAVLAARPLVGRRMRPVLAVVCVSLLAVSVARVASTEQRTVLAGAGGLPAGREAGDWIDSPRAEGGDLHDDRPVDGEPRAVLRAARGARALGEPEPAQPQPVVRADPEPGPGAPHRRHPVRRLGHLLGVARSRLLRSPAGLRRALRRPRRARRDAPDGHRGRPHRQEAGDRRLRGAAVSRRVALLLALTATAWAVSAQAASAEVPPATPIRHFVVLMQENHSFDNYFGTYPGADGIPPGACMPIHPSRGRRPCVRPFRLGDRAGPDLPHDGSTHRAQARGGHMDGFISGVSQGRQLPESAVMGHYDGRDLPFYWNVAGEYVLFDRWFASSRGGSVPNRLAWVAGSPRSRATIFDRLERRGISWKFYVEDYDPSQRRRAGAPPATSKQAVRVPLLNMPRFVHRPRLLRHIVDLDQYYDDLRNGTLPQVAYIAPAGGSEHPPRRPETGQTLVRSLVTALARSTLWPHSAFLWTYDEWGGWYDHVPPPAGRGFRVPALLVSPFARQGAVDGTTLEHASVPRFIEHNWGLRPLSRRDARANDITSAFDFAAAGAGGRDRPGHPRAGPGPRAAAVGHLPLVRRGAWCSRWRSSAGPAGGAPRRCRSPPWRSSSSWDRAPPRRRPPTAFPP